MTQPWPEPQGKRQRIPPKKPTAVGWLEPESSGAFPWRRVLLLAVAVLGVAAGAF